jgi:hypothetical protein
MAQVRLIKALQSFDNFVGFVGNDPTNEEEFNALQPVIGRQADSGEEDVVWVGTPPTWAEVQAKLWELQQIEDAKEQTKASGYAKLITLGLTAEEATALTGYTPQPE